MTPEADIIEAATGMADLLASQVLKHQTARDKAIRRALGRVERLARKRFRRQRKAVLDSHALMNLAGVLRIAGHMREADADRTRLEADIAASLGTHVYHVAVTHAEEKAFARAVATAIDNGGWAASDMLGITQPDAESFIAESFIAEYLKDGGFTRLTGDLDKTTVDRLASAVANAYESGADFDGITRAVKDTFTEATDVRAKMIAQTELNDAWNQSIFHFGEQAGATLKSWVCELGACIICLENQAAGAVEMDSDFPSGDDAPTAHPSCFCSLVVHA